MSSSRPTVGTKHPSVRLSPAPIRRDYENSSPGGSGTNPVTGVGRSLFSTLNRRGRSNSVSARELQEARREVAPQPTRPRSQSNAEGARYAQGDSPAALEAGTATNGENNGLGGLGGLWLKAVNRIQGGPSKVSLVNDRDANPDAAGAGAGPGTGGGMIGNIKGRTRAMTNAVAIRLGYGQAEPVDEGTTDAAEERARYDRQVIDLLDVIGVYYL